MHHRTSHSLLFLRECVCFSLLFHCVFECQFGTLRRAALLLSLPKRLSFRLLVRWLRQDSGFLHLSLKCFRSFIPVAVQIVSVPGLWNNRQGKQKNALLTEQPANQLRLAYRLEEKLRVYVLPVRPHGRCSAAAFLNPDVRVPCLSVSSYRHLIVDSKVFSRHTHRIKVSASYVALVDT